MRKLLNHLASILRLSSDVPASQAPPSSQAQANFVAFQAHNELEELLIKAARKPEEREAFQRELLKADLFAATPDAPPEGEAGVRTISAGERLSILDILGPDGTQTAAVFTAQERIVEVFGMGTGFISMKGETLLGIVVNSGA